MARFGRYRGALIGCAALVALAGCAGGPDDSFFAQPGKFDFLQCKDIASRTASTSTREKELASLIERANQGAAGPLVSTLVYAADIEQARADLRLLHQAAREKNCDAVTPAK